MCKKSKLIKKKKHTKKGSSALKAQNTEFFPFTSTPVDHILSLQRSIGNQVVRRLFKGVGGRRLAVRQKIQAKLKIGQPNDTYEQEADRVADQVMNMPNSTIQPKPT